MPQRARWLYAVRTETGRRAVARRPAAVIANFAGGFKEALIKWARAFGERVWRKTRFEKGRNTLCISSFSNRRIAPKAPPKAADH